MRLSGILLISVGLVLSAAYVYLMLFAPEEVALYAIRYTLLAIILLLSSILVFIGYTVLRAPIPPSLDKIRKEVESKLRERGAADGRRE